MFVCSFKVFPCRILKHMVKLEKLEYCEKVFISVSHNHQNYNK